MFQTDIRTTITGFHNNMGILSSCLSEGRLKVNISEITLTDVEKLLELIDPSLSLGGHWKPHDCLPRWKVSQLLPAGGLSTFYPSSEV